MLEWDLFILGSNLVTGAILVWDGDGIMGLVANSPTWTQLVQWLLQSGPVPPPSPRSWVVQELGIHKKHTKIKMGLKKHNTKQLPCRAKRRAANITARSCSGPKHRWNFTRVSSGTTENQWGSDRLSPYILFVISLSGWCYTYPSEKWWNESQLGL